MDKMYRDFAEFAEWIGERFSAGYKLQIAFGKEGKSVLAWLPGASRKEEGWSIPRSGVMYLGCSTRGYKGYYTPMIEQPCELAGATIDIDGKDNPHLSTEELRRITIQCVEGAGSVRSSCSGSGLHVFFRLDEPISIGKGVPSKDITALARMVSAEWVKKITEAGVHVDKTDSRLMWVVGGKNVWLYRTDHFVQWSGEKSIPDKEIELDQNRTGGIACADPFALSWLKRLNIGVGPCVVATIVERLRAAGEYVETSSQRRDRMNGEIRAEPGWIGLWAWSDKRYIWQAWDF
jgi:hypothetical protein